VGNNQGAAFDPRIPLQQASWWKPAQAEFLTQAIEEDPDWAEQLNELGVLLCPAAREAY